MWHYPRDEAALDATGLATLIPPGHPPLCTDNAPYDPRAMQAAMADVQLPAIATLTNLENGRAVRLRIDDRGPANPGRLIAVTQGVARLLGMRGPTRVRVRFDVAANLALAQQLDAPGEHIPMTAAPVGEVRQAALAPLPGSRQEAGRAVAPMRQAPAPGAQSPVIVPARLPPTLITTAPDPGRLMLDAGSFTHADAADMRARVLLDVGARVERAASGRVITYRVLAGPFASVPEADAALARAIRNGATDSRLVVELD